MENVYPQLAKTLHKEVRDVMDQSIDGIKLIMNDTNYSIIEVYFAFLLIFEAVIDGPKDTPFDGGRFKVKLVFPMNYPTEPPKGYFLTKIFHPNVNWRTGEICVDTLKREWKPDLGLRHILMVIENITSILL